MKWYDLVAPVYELSGTSWVYRRMRRETVRQLRPASDLTVLDLACGTGLNFGLLAEAIGPGGTLIGVDFSDRMLQQARRRVTRRGWEDRIHLVRLDAPMLSAKALDEALPGELGQIDRALCTLGLSVVPDWENVFARMWRLLARGGRCAIMDVHFEDPTLTARILNAIAASDISRRFWEPLRALSQSYEERVFPFLGGRILVASGTKPGDRD